VYKQILVLSALIFATTAVGQTLDPTKPFSYSASSGKSANSETKLVLESIIHGDEVHTVVISGQIVKMGEMVNNHKLVAVNTDNVLLRSDTETLRLHLFPKGIVKHQ